MTKKAKSTRILLLGIALQLGCSDDPGEPLSTSEGSGGDSGLGTDTTSSGGSGQLGSGGGDTGLPPLPNDATCAEAGDDAGESVLRRLSKLEYQLTLQDLFDLPDPPSVDLVPDDAHQEGFSTFSHLQSVTAGHLRAYWDTVSPLAADLAAVEYAACTAPGGCLRDFAGRFGRLAFRRFLSETELDEWTARAQENAVDLEDQYQYLIEGLLLSPHFLFRVEVGNEKEGLSTLNSEELASKLSFALWGRAPSSELLDRAAQGELDTTSGLESVAAEMLESPKVETFYRQFFRQWLGYGQLRAPVEPPQDWSDELMPQMTQETDTLVAEFAWNEGQDFLDVLTTNHTTVTRDLATFYGEEVTPGAEESSVIEYSPLDPRQNAGVLGHAALLSQKKDGDKISVRGNWLRRTFLCHELEIPPEVAAVLGEQLVGLTSLQIVEHRNEEPACRKCHSVIDPIGVGLAQFDATGRFDETVDLGDYPIAPGLPDAADPHFSTLGELAAKLRAMPEVSACLAQKAFVYAEGRHPEPLDACSYQATSSGFAEEGGSFRALLRHLVSSPGFRLRRAPSSTL